MLRRDIADYKVNQAEYEEKIQMQKSELTRCNTLLKNAEQREFILKQQLEGINDVVMEEKKYLHNELDDLRNKNKELQEQVDELGEEVEAYKTGQKRRHTGDKASLNGLLKELNGMEKNTEDTLDTAESEGTTTQRRRSSLLKKDQMFQLLNKHYEDKKDPKKQEELANKKQEEHDQQAQKITELESKLQGMSKMVAQFQTNLTEEKKRNELAKKQMEIKDKELDHLRDKLIQSSQVQAELLGEYNEQMDANLEMKRKLFRQLKNYGFTGQLSDVI